MMVYQALLGMKEKRVALVQKVSVVSHKEC